jgi:hypothetical protein
MRLAACLTLVAVLVTTALAVGHSSGEPVSPKLVGSQTSEGGTFPATIRVMPGSPARVELTNTGTQPITAWSFTVATLTARACTRGALGGRLSQ